MSRPPRILYLVNAFETDAPTRLTTAIARAMHHQGWKVLFVAWSRDGELRANLEHAALPLAVLGKTMVQNAISLKKLMRQFQPDLIHTALARPALGYALARVLPKRATCKWIAADHGVHEWHEKGAATGWLMDRVMPSVLMMADCVVTVSSDARQALISRGLNSARVQVVSNGVDVQRFYPGLPRDERQRLIDQLFPGQSQHEIQYLVGSAGNLRQIKGYDILLHAVPQVLEKFSGARFIIWGDGPEREELLEQAKHFGIENAVAFAGYERELPQRLPLLDLYVQPSRVESFGMGAAEAMACGLPVVVSDVGGLSELIESGKSGRTFPAENDCALANEIVDLLRNPHQRMALGNAARLRILQHFSQQGMVSAMREIYEQNLPTRNDHRE